MIPRILRLYALCSGSDRPIPRGSGLDVDMSDASGVVAKEPREEIEEALLLREVEGIASPGDQPGPFYRSLKKRKA